MTTAFEKLEVLKIPEDESGEYAESIIKSVHEPLIALDQNLRVVTASRSFYEVYKVTPEATVGKLIYDLGNKQWNIPKLRELLETILPQKTIFENYEVEHDFATIGRRIMLLNAVQIQRGKGKEHTILLAIEDITERKRTEELSRNLAAIVNSADYAIIGIISKDLNGIIQTWNAGAESLFGYEAEEVIGKHISLLVPPDHSDELPKIFDRIKRGEHIDNLETVRIRKDGTKINVSVSISAIKDVNGNVIGASKIAHDITERKRSEALLQNANNELAAANKELEAFSYYVSHDLRAPLRTVREFSKIVYEDYAEKLDAQGRDYLTRIKNGTDRMNNLIEDLLRLSQISRQKLDLMSYDLSSLASAVVNSLRRADPSRNVEVVIAEGLRAVVDPNLMRMALTNLLNNAWKFTSKTENARIEFGSVENASKTVYFVKDNGAGFDATQAERMFLPFQRLHTAKEFEGTGIGLAMVERIVRGHQGKIWAEGKEGKGAAIYFTLGTL